MKHGTVLALAAALVCAAGPAEVRAGGPLQPTVEQAAAQPAQDLAKGYLLVRYHLAFMDWIRKGTTFVTAIDGDPQQIDSSNVELWDAGLKRRLETYATAIRLRGFDQVAAEYVPKKGGDCIYAASNTVKLEQDEFRLRLAVSPAPDVTPLVHEGVIVESTVVFEDAMNPERYLVGKAAKGKVRLEDRDSGCKIDLASR